MTAKKKLDGTPDGRKGGRQPGLGKYLPKKPRRKKEPTSLVGHFGRYIAIRREHAGLSLRAFSKLADMPASNYFQMESLSRNPRLTELEKLAKAYDESLLTFLRPLLLSYAAPPGEVLEQYQHHVATQ
jgi:ribosome-binding protein aMBF1 (putative translation factor)